ncbi:MAG: helix-turn-helix transcriptional regulator [Prevotella sp.]|nr:helix-turn-helix transcriptional regulator [Prevotella sp.]
MDQFFDDIIPALDLDACANPRFTSHVLFALCLDGEARFTADGETRRIAVGDLLVKPDDYQLADFSCSDDFQVSALLISSTFLSSAMSEETSRRTIKTFKALEPSTNADDNTDSEKHPLLLPIQPSDFDRCQRDIDNICQRLSHPYHNFYVPTLQRAVELLVIDVCDIVARQRGQAIEGVNQATRLLQRLVALLQEGRYKKERSVDYYSSLMGITAKYLSEACVAASGHNASYWIERFTIEEIARQLADLDKPLTDIATDLNFSSLSYLSRYIKRAFGCTPSEYRQRLK